MASRERPAPALDDDHVDDPPEAAAAALADAAEAEAVAAEAEARAAAARARALRLQRQAAETPGARTGRSRGRWLRRPAVGAAIAVVCISLAASGYMLWQHHGASQQQQRTAEFAAAARQAIVTFMSLDFNQTGEDMRRIADLSTGQFKDRFPAVADELTKRLQRSKVVTAATVNDVAVESMTDNSAIVLVAVTTTAQQPDDTQQPQSWHIALGLTEDGGRPKMSTIEFVP